MRLYTAPLSLTTLVCFMGTLQSIAVTFVMEHKASVWSIGWDMNLLAAAYAVSHIYLSTFFPSPALSSPLFLLSSLTNSRVLCHQALHTMFKDW